MACDCNVEAGQYIEDKFFLLKLRATDRTKVAITDPKKKKNNTLLNKKTRNWRINEGKIEARKK